MTVSLDPLTQKPEDFSTLDEKNLMAILDEAKQIFSQEKNLISLPQNKKLLFVGDTHGYLNATKIVIKEGFKRKADHIIFLGDYVDRGPKQIENAMYLFSLKIKHPEKIILLRGNHEATTPNLNYGFMEEVHKSYSEKLYEKFEECFSHLPLAVITGERIFAVHGGIPNNLEKIEEIDSRIMRKEKDPLAGPLMQLLWNDPADFDDFFRGSMRGKGIYEFGEAVFTKFAQNNNIKLMIRSHEFFPEGYKYFFNKKLLSIFSAPDYCLRGNRGKIAMVVNKTPELIKIKEI